MSRARLPPQWFGPAFALVMGGAMTAVVTLALALVFAAPDVGLLQAWLPRWAIAWAVATPVIAVLSPRVRRWLSAWIVPPGA